MLCCIKIMCFIVPHDDGLSVSVWAFNVLFANLGSALLHAGLHEGLSHTANIDLGTDACSWHVFLFYI